MTTTTTTVRTARFDRWQRNPSDFKETAGFFLVMLLGLWALANTSLTSDFGLPTVATWFAIGLFLAVMFGNSDNHFNPLITIGAWLAGMFGTGTIRSVLQVAVRILEGIIATIVAVLVVWAMYGGQFADKNFGAPSATGTNWLYQVLAILGIYFLYTFLSLWVIDHGSMGGRGAKLKTAVLLSVLLWIGIYFSAKFAGGVNTSRELVPMIFGLDLDLTPIIFGPLAAAAAGVAYRVLRKVSVY